LLIDHFVSSAVSGFGDFFEQQILCLALVPPVRARLVDVTRIVLGKFAKALEFSENGEIADGYLFQPAAISGPAAPW
jgi:hypothetical protein